MYPYQHITPIAFVDPSGLALEIYWEDLEMFTELAKIIFDDNEFEFSFNEDMLNDGKYVIDEWKDSYDNYGGSEIGKALLKTLIEVKGSGSVGDNTIKIDFENSGNLIESSYDGGYVSIYLGEEMAYSTEEILTVLIHELGHAYVNIYDYESKLSYSIISSNSNYNSLIREKYSEAAAITIEEQFRKEMGFEPRDTSVGTIGTDLNSYGAWPINLTRYINSTSDDNIQLESSLSLAQTIFISYDVLRKAGYR